MIRLCAFDSTEIQNKFVYKSNREAFVAAVDAIKAVLTAEGYTEKDGGFIK